MKKILATALALATMTTMMVGCGSTPKNTEGSSSTVSNSSQASLETTPTGDKLDDILKKGKIVMVTSPDYAPYEFIDLSKAGQGDAQYAGMDVELGRYIAEQLGVTLEIKAMSFDAVLTAVTENGCDIAISGLAPREDRKEKMDFTDTYSVGTSAQGLLVRTEDLEKYKTPEDLKGKVIAYQNGSEQQNIAETQLTDIQGKPIGKLTDGIMELKTKKVDALVISSTSGDMYDIRYDDLSMTPITFDGTKGGVSVAVPKGNDAFVKKLNEIVAKAQEEKLTIQWMNDAKELAASLME